MSAQPEAAGVFRVLVVEDNPHVSEIFRYAFKRIVFDRLGKAVEVQVEEAGDGHVAWQRIQDAAAHGVGFELVVLDLMLPVLDGTEVLARMRGDDACCDVPVLVITASDGETVAKAEAAGATAVLRKPVQFKEIREVVARVLPAQRG